MTDPLDHIGVPASVDASPALARQVGAALRARRMTLATAESCTGGLIGYRMTAIPGSSEYYLGGIVAYSNAVKVALLAVSEDSLETVGAVSSEVAEQMSLGARERLGADIAVSVTGIAGPGGGGPGKPVGLVYIAVATSEGAEPSRHQFAGGRSEIRAAAASAALRAVLGATNLGLA
jgi:PncC family amidohydrolase